MIDFQISSSNYFNSPTINCRYSEEHDGADYVQRVEYCKPEHQVVEWLGAGLRGKNNDAGDVTQYPQTTEQYLKTSMYQLINHFNDAYIPRVFPQL